MLGLCTNVAEEEQSTAYRFLLPLSVSCTELAELSESIISTSRKHNLNLLIWHSLADPSFNDIAVSHAFSTWQRRKRWLALAAREINRRKKDVVVEYCQCNTLRINSGDMEGVPYH
ncbi:hypothetical protein D918_00393 [Trichuris suis]|nr:hypothetical protein D918_00393 [Trichuris suis]